MEQKNLADWPVIAEMVNQHGWLIDNREFERAREICTDDVEVQTPVGSKQGVGELVAQLEKVHTAHERTHHVVGNVKIDFEDGGDRARVAAKGIAILVSGEGELGATLAAVRYGYDAVRTDDGWRFASLTVDPQWFYPSPS